MAELLFLLVLILLNAFFAASEIALISLNDTKIRYLAEDGDKKAQLIQHLLSEPSRFLATIQIGITLAGFLASAFAAQNFADGLVRILQKTGLSLSDLWLRSFSVLLITLVLAYFTLVLGELVPKRLAMNRAERIAMAAIRPLYILSVAAYPFVRLLTISTNFFVRMFGVKPGEEEQKVTEEEIRMMVDVGEEIGTIHKAEKLMINNIFEFNDKMVDDIMTHRIDIAALPLEASLDETVAFFNQEKYSRVPVYSGNIDNIVGVMHAKDLIEVLSDEKAKDAFDLTTTMRPPYFVAESKKTNELFSELQRNKHHLAIILDEHGGTAGIVTLEDLLEEIVGDILDEDDEEIKHIHKIDSKTLLMNGGVSLATVKDYLDLEMPTGEYETLSGFIIGQLGRIPGKDDHPCISFGEWTFRVEEADEKKVIQVLVRRTQEKPPLQPPNTEPF
ncbi:MAG: hemolysin family protein [Syntrophomonadaceae bacterium]